MRQRDKNHVISRHCTCNNFYRFQAVHSHFFSFFRASSFFAFVILMTFFFALHLLLREKITFFAPDLIFREKYDIRENRDFFCVKNWTSADVMTFFCSSLDFAWKIGHFQIFFHFFQQIAIIFFHFFVDSQLDSLRFIARYRKNV